MSQTIPQNQHSTSTESGLDVELRKVFKVFNGEAAVRGVDLAISQGEFLAFWVRLVVAKRQPYV